MRFSFKKLFLLLLYIAVVCLLSSCTSVSFCGSNDQCLPTVDQVQYTGLFYKDTGQLVNYDLLLQSQCHPEYLDGKVCAPYTKEQQKITNKNKQAVIKKCFNSCRISPDTCDDQYQDMYNTVRFHDTAVNLINICKQNLPIQEFACQHVCVFQNYVKPCYKWTNVPYPTGKTFSLRLGQTITKLTTSNGTINSIDEIYNVNVTYECALGDSNQPYLLIKNISRTLAVNNQQD